MVSENKNLCYSTLLDIIPCFISRVFVYPKGPEASRLRGLRLLARVRIPLWRAATTSIIYSYI